MYKFKFSVVMPTWIVNDELYRLTDQTLMSFHKSEGWKDCELVIVDNASPIGGDQLLMNCNTYVRNKENLGYPKAVNQGLELATGDYIAVVNNDIRVSPNWIEVAKRVFNELKKIGSLHFKMVDYEAPFNLGDAVWDTGKERWCTGSFFVFNKMALLRLEEDCGYVMDEDYGMGGFDDYDWQYRMREKCGWKTAYTNAAAYQHKDSTTQNLRDKDERKNSDNKNYEHFKKKYGEYPDIYWAKKFPKQHQVPWRPFP